MKKILFSLAAVAALLGMVSCSTESVEVPVITDLGITANPCRPVPKGVIAVVIVLLPLSNTGNEELGSYNLKSI